VVCLIVQIGKVDSGSAPDMLEVIQEIQELAASTREDMKAEGDCMIGSRAKERGHNPGVITTGKCRTTLNSKYAR